MDRAAVVALISRRILEIAAQKGAAAPQIAPETPLFEGRLPIDSLDLAGLVVELETATGVEPFREGLVDFHTIGDLAALFAPHA
jgi:acyl carrier protein